MSLFSRLFKRDDAPEGESAGASEAQASAKEGAQETARAAGERKAAPASKTAAAQAAAPSAKEPSAAQKANEPPPLRKSAKEGASAAQPAAKVEVKAAAPPPLKSSSASDKQPAAAATATSPATKAAATSAPERGASAERAASQALHKGQTMLGMPVASTPSARTASEPEKSAAIKPAATKPVVGDTDKTLPMRTDSSDAKARAKADVKVTVTEPDKGRAPAQVASAKVTEPTKARTPAEAQAPKPAAAAVDASPKPAAQPTAESLAQSARDAFRREAPQALAPFMELLVELYANQTLHREWMARAVAGLKALSAHAEKLDDAGLRASLEEAQGVLAKAEQVGAAPVDEALSAELSRSYERLRARVPEAQDPRRELARRDDVLVEALLLSVEGMHPHALQRLRAAGWDKSARFVQRGPEALMHETGLDLALCQGICAAFSRFSEEFPGMVPAPTRVRELARLATLVDTLRAQQARFEQAAAGFSEQDLTQRRVLRAERLYTTRQISAILSRLGEVERVTLLDRAPYAQKIAHLTEFLRDARAPQAALS